jgi:hypothetical protein
VQIFGRDLIRRRRIWRLIWRTAFPAQNLSDVGTGFPMRVETDDLGTQNGRYV